MNLQLVPATDLYLPFARDLTRRAMLPYYARHDLLWQDAGFEAAWHWRDNQLVCDGERVLGYLSLSSDAQALFIRELHLEVDCRGQGVGSWVLGQVISICQRKRLPLLRLMVFKGNPAQALYRRHGFAVVGDDDSFLRMERKIQPA